MRHALVTAAQEGSQVGDIAGSLVIAVIVCGLGSFFIWGGIRGGGSFKSRAIEFLMGVGVIVAGIAAAISVYNK